jgi:hypothetical protein
MSDNPRQPLGVPYPQLVGQCIGVQLTILANRPNGVSMSDRQYRHRGYRDEPRERERQAPQGPREKPEGPKTPNLMASHEVFRCGRCGNLLAATVEAEDRCSRCGVDLHSCVQCVSFDPGSPLECMQPIQTRVAPKDVKNACTCFAPRVTVERQTGTARPTSARQAFDDLFK